MDLTKILIAAVAMGLLGLVILGLLWPNERSARKLLGKWGIPEPLDDEVAVGLRYLRQRRFWYPWLYLLLPLLGQAIGIRFAQSDSVGPICAALLLGGLLAELFAQRPSRGTQRAAILERRRILDFADRWMLIVTGLVEVGSIAYVVAQARWALFAIALAAAAASWLIVALAVRRPAAGTRQVDLALRCRSTRIALGLGIGATAMICWSGNNVAAILALLISVIALRAVGSPPRKLPAIAVQPG